MRRQDLVKTIKASNGNGLNLIYKSLDHRYTGRGIKTVRYYHVFIGCHQLDGTEHEGVTNYGYLTRFNFTNKAEAIKYAKQTTAPVYGSPDRRINLGGGHWISIKNAKSIEDRCKQGIHLIKPTQRELQDAIETAERDLFTTIWIHEVERQGLTLIQGGAA
jgi:hypothetical protein